VLVAATKAGEKKAEVSGKRPIKINCQSSMTGIGFLSQEASPETFNMVIRK